MDKEKNSQFENINKKYSIIYADPPWAYNDKRKGSLGGATNHYDTMSIEELKKMNIANLADTNCALFLWATFPNLEIALELMKTWGFEYKTVGFSWVKTNKNNGKPFFGIGYYTKSNVEVCLLGIKGKMKPISNYISSVVISPRREHSRKPDEVRDKIVELFGDLPRIELFARTHTPGWDVHGNEVNIFGGINYE